MGFIINIHPSEVEFLESRSEDQLTVSAGYAKNLREEVKTKYENFYRKHVDGGFVLDRNCGVCVYKMLAHIFGMYEAHKATLEAAKSMEAEEVVEPIKKPAKKRK